MTDSCEAAIAAGVTEIAFTDHVEHQHTDEGFGYYRIDDYFSALEAVRERYRGRLTVLAGAEVDYHTDTREQVGQWIAANGRRYDFVIGSVHYGENAQIIFQEYFEGRALDDVVLPYLDEIEGAVRSGWFDTIGHLDIPKRYLPTARREYDPGRYRERLHELFKLFVDQGVSFEINTSGLRQTPKSSMPGPAIVRWYRDAGGTLITTGTDSHAAQTVGAGLVRTLDMLSLVGIEAIGSFRGRERRQVPIADLRTLAVAT
jgi:histidinol-phosphatase (PHP family)